MRYIMPYNQKGLTAISWLAILSVFFFFVLIMLRLAPIYMEHFNVSGSLQSLQEDRRVVDSDKAEIKQLLLKRFQINDVKNVTGKHIKVTEKGVQVKYEVRVNVIANVDAVVAFDDFVRLNLR